VDTRTQDSPGVVGGHLPADMMREALDEPEPIFTAEQHRALSWWKANYQLELMLEREGIADDGHEFAHRLAFAVWLHVTGRISEEQP
jgi:hypothetical protein